MKHLMFIILTLLLTCVGVVAGESVVLGKPLCAIFGAALGVTSYLRWFGRTTKEQQSIKALNWWS